MRMFKPSLRSMIKPLRMLLIKTVLKKVLIIVKKLLKTASKTLEIVKTVQNLKVKRLI